MPRKRRTPKERTRLFEHHGGKCHICGQKIKVGEVWELEHLVAWELTRDESDDNVKPAHASCHKAKTANDVREIRKADRMKARHVGAHKPKSSWGNSKYKKKLDGSVVLREQ